MHLTRGWELFQHELMLSVRRGGAQKFMLRLDELQHGPHSRHCLQPANDASSNKHMPLLHDLSRYREQKMPKDVRGAPP
jgi:hypothetical protein